MKYQTFPGKHTVILGTPEDIEFEIPVNLSLVITKLITNIDWYNFLILIDFDNVIRKDAHMHKHGEDLINPFPISEGSIYKIKGSYTGLIPDGFGPGEKLELEICLQGRI
jgi:hypothetical protein